MDADSADLNIAVVGGGVAGVTACFLLQQRHKVTLYEANEYVGGHTHTVTIPGGPDQGLPVDTGFIVLNDRTYPLFNRLLGRLGVSVRDTEMSFSFQSETTGLEYAGTGLNGLFAQRRNLVRPAYWLMLAEVVRFCRAARADLAAGRLRRMTLHEYVARGGYHADMVAHYLVPMASAIWSTPPGEVSGFPVEPFLRFFDNHGLLSPFHRPRWQTVEGGSHSYVRAFLARFQGGVRVGAPVSSVRRTKDGVIVLSAPGAEEAFDRVVIAAHADEALGVLDDPSEAERDLLGRWRYQNNRVVLHTDENMLPSSRRAWACWNYRGVKDTVANPLGCVTYLMNALQGFDTETQYCVTVNPSRPIAPGKTIEEFTYSHPTYSFASMDSQASLATLNGLQNTYFCGSYFGYGFHEDAVRAGAAVGKAFGCDL